MIDEPALLTELIALRKDFAKHVTENSTSHRELMSENRAIQTELLRHGDEEKKMNALVLGDNGTIGLLERMRVQERFYSRVGKMFGVIIPSVVIGAAALVWNAVVFYLRKGDL